MANFSALKTAIQNAIKQNGNEEITGDVLQQILLSIVSTMGDGAINTIEQNLSNETTTRQSADTQLQNAINAIKANIDNGYVYAGIATPSSTPVSGKVFYIATAAGTYTNFGGQVLTQGINILRYNGSAWTSQQLIGIDDAPTAGSNSLVKSGGVQNELALGAVYDVSAKNPTGGPNNDGKWESLSALLSDANLNTLIPTAYRKGGMSIKFVHSSDNKYVQARCMAQNFTTDVTQWQGVDDKPTSGSDNLVKSGVLYSEISTISGLIGDNKASLNGEVVYRQGFVNVDGGVGDSPSLIIDETREDWKYVILDITEKQLFSIKGKGNISTAKCYTFLDENDTIISSSQNYSVDILIKSPLNAKKLVCNFNISDSYELLSLDNISAKVAKNKTDLDFVYQNELLYKVYNGIISDSGRCQYYTEGTHAIIKLNNNSNVRIVYNKTIPTVVALLNDYAPPYKENAYIGSIVSRNVYSSAGIYSLDVTNVPYLFVSLTSTRGNCSPNNIYIDGYDVLNSVCENIATNNENIENANEQIGFGIKNKIVVNKGWMTSDGVTNHISTASHFIIPILPQDVVYIENSSANTSISAFLSDYQAPQSDEEPYSICEGTSRETGTFTAAAPSDAKYLFVGRYGDQLESHIPNKIVINGVDILSDFKMYSQEIETIENVTFDGQTLITGYWTLCFAKVREGDVINYFYDVNKTAPVSSQYQPYIAKFSNKPYVGITANEVTRPNTYLLYQRPKTIISDFNGYIGITFMNVVDNKKVVNRFSVTTKYPLLQDSDVNIKSDIYNADFNPNSCNNFKTPLYVCHRGLQVFGPENSLPAFVDGGKNGVWAIETDFRITSDGKVVCIHDDTINRTMVNIDGTAIEEDIYVSQKTLNELQTEYKIAEINSTTIPNKQYDYSAFSNSDLVIPTIDDYFSICQRYGVIPFIELKEDNGIIDIMIEKIKEYKLTGKCVVSSSYYSLLSLYRSKGGEEYVHKVGGNVDDFDNLIALGNAGLAFANSTPFALDSSKTYNDITVNTPAELCRLTHSLGLRISFGACDTSLAAIEAINVGADYISTNNLWKRNQVLH